MAAPHRICAIDWDDPADAARSDQMVALVERMLDLHKRLGEAKTPGVGTPRDTTLLQHQSTC